MPSRGVVVLQTLANSGAGTFNSGPFSVESDPGLNLAVVAAVTVNSGTPTVDVKVQWSNDGVNWADADGTADTLAQVTTTKAVAKVFPVKGALARVQTLIGGTTPNVSATVSAYSVR